LTGPVTALIRPEGASLSMQGGCDLEGTVIERSFRGRAYRLTLAVGGMQLAFDLPSTQPVPTEGQPVRICLAADAVQAFPAGNEIGLSTS
jgi:ABC-type Fe3+/spermidine/putrescine transport system ATPase subunit